MKIKYRVKITEGMVYNGVKAGVEDFLRTVRKTLEGHDEPRYTDRTGSLKHSVSCTILRNGTPIDDESVKPFRDKSIKETGAKYSACVYIDGMNQTVTI